MAECWSCPGPQRGGLYGKTTILAAITVSAHVTISVKYTIFYRRSAAQYSMLSIGSLQGSSHKLAASVDVSRFIKEQRKILKTVRSQPWAMHVKVNAVRYVIARVNNIYIEESILLPYTSVETRSVK